MDEGVPSTGTQLGGPPPPEPHLVQLYHHDAFLARAVADWVAPALRDGGAAVLIGTPAHGEAIAARLAEDGLDVARLRTEHRLLMLNAAPTLARIQRRGRVDLRAFDQVLGAAVAAARGADPGREVRAWGELVDLLCEAGRPEEAMALEEMWNGFLDRTGVRLLCSYRAEPFDPSLYPARLRVYAHGHARFLPMENEAFFEASVRAAVQHVCGGYEADLTGALERRPMAGLDLPMARGQRLLAAMHQVLPDYGRRVLANAQANYGAVLP